MFFKKKTAAPIEEPKNDILRCGQCRDCAAGKGNLYCKQSLREVQKGERTAVLTVTSDAECYYIKNMSKDGNISLTL
jgi:Zn-dependent alcohol dehydrogenase